MSGHVAAADGETHGYAIINEVMTAMIFTSGERGVDGGRR